MQFGYFTLTDNSPGYGDRRRDHSQFLREVIDEAIAAEALGFNSAWLPEHHFGLFGVLPTPAQALTYIAAKTSRIKLAPATVLLPCTQHGRGVRRARRAQRRPRHILSGSRL